MSELSARNPMVLKAYETEIIVSGIGRKVTGYDVRLIRMAERMNDALAVSGSSFRFTLDAISILSVGDLRSTFSRKLTGAVEEALGTGGRS